MHEKKTGEDQNESAVFFFFFLSVLFFSMYLLLNNYTGGVVYSVTHSEKIYNSQCCRCPCLW